MSDVKAIYERIEKSRNWWKKVFILEYARNHKKFMEEVSDNIDNDDYREELFTLCHTVEQSKRKKEWYYFSKGYMDWSVIQDIIRKYKDAYEFFVHEQQGGADEYAPEEPQPLAKLLEFRPISRPR